VTAVRARAPASSANLGPGFDTLAVALDCYVSVEVETADALRVHSEGEGAGLFDDASHLAARVVTEVLGHDRVAITVRSQIPVARGLGSSAALAAAAAAAAGADDPFALAAAYDGHAENAAASVFGGLLAATTVEGVPLHAPLPLSEDLAFVALVPERDLATPEARGVLPDTLSRDDAVFNLGRMGLLVAGLADPARLVGAATEDRIHQAARTALFPEAPGLLDALVEAGALAACWSGAGPTLIGFVTRDRQEHLRLGAQAALAASGVPGRVLALAADRRGLVYGDEAIVDL
jgi:homoserine kinase